MTIFTIGFTRKTAEQFFNCLRQPGLIRLVDVRLNNVSQLAGFTKKNDLAFFAREICGVDYVHLPQLAPTQELLNAYKRDGGGWRNYEEQFLGLLDARHITETLDRDMIEGGCLLCSEALPEHCHRRLVAEYLRERWGNVDICHL